MRNRLVILVAAVVAAGMVSQAEAVVITLNPVDDAYIQKGADSPHDEPEIVLKDSGTGTTTRKGYLRFDLSSIAFPITDATLQLTLSRRDGGPYTVEVFGLTDESLDGWLGEDETTLKWTNAPANDTTDNDFTSAASYFGSFGVATTDTVGTLFSFTDPDLTAFLAADTNNQASILLRRVGGNSSHNLSFASTESTSYAYPALVLNVVPEPSTLAMLLGLAGVSLLGWMRRRRRR